MAGTAAVTTRRSDVGADVADPGDQPVTDLAAQHQAE